MTETRAEKTVYILDHKMDQVLLHGCVKCGKGKSVSGFEKYWLPIEVYYYEPRRFVFKYTDKRGSDIPVAKLPREKKSTLKSIEAALSRCVILCRSCADPRRTRKEMTPCPKPPTTTLQSDS